MSQYLLHYFVVPYTHNDDDLTMIDVLFINVEVIILKSKFVGDKLKEGKNE